MLTRFSNIDHNVSNELSLEMWQKQKMKFPPPRSLPIYLWQNIDCKRGQKWGQCLPNYGAQRWMAEDKNQSQHVNLCCEWRWERGLHVFGQINPSISRQAFAKQTFWFITIDSLNHQQVFLHFCWLHKHDFKPVSWKKNHYICLSF